MWPIVEIKKGEIEFLNFKVHQMNREKCQNPNTVIREIVMLYANYGDVSYPEDCVPLAVSYDTDFGLHTILFSMEKNLPYENHGSPWIATYTSDPTHNYSPYTRIMDDGTWVEEEKLTLMFKNILKDLNFIF